jgi:hypothetical protein
MKATLTGALGGLLFGFDTVVISGAIDALVKLYGLSPRLARAGRWPSGWSARWWERWARAWWGRGWAGAKRCA